jgi:hypothetical protein
LSPSRTKRRWSCFATTRRITFSPDVGAGLPLAFAIAKLFTLKIEDIFQAG